MRNIKSGLKPIKKIKFMYEYNDMKVIKQLYEKTKQGMKPFKVNVENVDGLDIISEEEVNELFNE